MCGDGGSKEFLVGPQKNPRRSVLGKGSAPFLGGVKSQSKGLGKAGGIKA